MPQFIEQILRRKSNGTRGRGPNESPDHGAYGRSPRHSYHDDRRAFHTIPFANDIRSIDVHYSVPGGGKGAAYAGLDTMSDANVICLDLVLHCRSKIYTDKDLNLQSASGTPYPLVGYIYLDIRLANRSQGHHEMFLVSERLSRDIVLGYPHIHRARILQRNDECNVIELIPSTTSAEEEADRQRAYQRRNRQRMEEQTRRLELPQARRGPVHHSPSTPLPSRSQPAIRPSFNRTAQGHHADLSIVEAPTRRSRSRSGQEFSGYHLVLTAMGTLRRPADTHISGSVTCQKRAIRHVAHHEDITNHGILRRRRQIQVAIPEPRATVRIHWHEFASRDVSSRQCRTNKIPCYDESTDVPGEAPGSTTMARRDCKVWEFGV